MGSSEINDSGKFFAGAGHKSNFSQTCSLLSRYLQEKGSFGDLTLGLSANFQPHGSSTKDLAPGSEKTPHQTSGTGAHGEQERAPMTIFYGGQVVVFNDFPADKAKEIMEIAMATNAGSIIQKPAESSAAAAAAAVASNMMTCLGNNMMLQQPQQTPQIPTQPLVHDLPIARKASLARFFQKRKDRLTAKGPYQQSNSVGSVASKAAGEDENKAWLGLAAQSPLQAELDN